MRIELPREKNQKIVEIVERFEKMKKCTIRFFASFVGTLGSCCTGVKYGWSFLKTFEYEKCIVLKANEGN